MPTDKPPTVSFNMWLSLQGDGPFTPIRDAWATTRGRLTRATVVARAVRAGASADLAGRAYDAYCLAVGRRGKDGDAPSEGDKALLDFDPSR
jgi:hypothetical protein